MYDVARLLALMLLHVGALHSWPLSMGVGLWTALMLLHVGAVQRWPLSTGALLYWTRGHGRAHRSVKASLIAARDSRDASRSNDSSVGSASDSWQDDGWGWEWG